MYKVLFFFAICFAAAMAAPVLLTATNHFPYTHGWTDGPNNGVGPTVLLTHPVLHHGYGANYVVY